MAKARSKEAGKLAPGGRTYKLITLVGTSDKSYEDAIQQAVKDASATLRGLAWFEVVEQRGMIKDDLVFEFQVTVRLGFRVLGR
jgi:hypothetical protein